MATSPFRNRANFERTVMTRQYGYNNTANNPQNIGGGGFAGSQGPSTVQNISNYSPNIVPQVAAARGGGGGGGGGGGRDWFEVRRRSRGRSGGKIICSKLYELKMLSKKIFQADQKFGKILAQQNPEVYDGYIAWAKTVVDWMEGKGPQCMFWIKDKKKRNKKQKELSRKWARDIATPWAKHMAFLMGVEKKDNLAGKIIMTLGKPVCKVVGRWRTIFGESRKEAGLIQGYSLWLLFAVFRLITFIFDKK